MHHEGVKGSGVRGQGSGVSKNNRKNHSVILAPDPWSLIPDPQKGYLWTDTDLQHVNPQHATKASTRLFYFIQSQDSQPKGQQGSNENRADKQALLLKPWVIQ